MQAPEGRQRWSETRLSRVPQASPRPFGCPLPALLRSSAHQSPTTHSYHHPPPPNPPTCTRCSKPLCARLACSPSRLPGPSSQACTRCPRAAAASDSRPYPAPTSAGRQAGAGRQAWGQVGLAAPAACLAHPHMAQPPSSLPEAAAGTPRTYEHVLPRVGAAHAAHYCIHQAGPPAGLHRGLPAAVRGDSGAHVGAALPLAPPQAVREQVKRRVKVHADRVEGPCGVGLGHAPRRLFPHILAAVPPAARHVGSHALGHRPRPRAAGWRQVGAVRTQRSAGAAAAGVLAALA